MNEVSLVEFINVQADFMNMKYFDGVLKYTCAMMTRENNRTYAHCHIVRGLNSRKLLEVPIIVINPILRFASPGEIELIMSHELVHIAQAVLGFDLTHGKDFRKIIRDYNLPDSVSKKCAPPEVRHLVFMKNNVRPATI